MRILHLIIRPQLRGAEQFAARLADRLERLGEANAVCSLYSSDEADSGYDFGSVQSYELSGTTSLFDRFMRIEPSTVMGIRRVVKDFKPDIVIGHGADTLKYAAISKLFDRRVRTVYMNIGLASYWAGSTSKRLFNKFWLRKIDRVISVSEFSSKDFIEHYGYDKKRVNYIPNAVDASRFTIDEPLVASGRIRHELGIGDLDVVIATVGRLSPEKGQDTLIRAVASLANRETPVKLVLVGDGPERLNLEAEVQSLGIEDRVSFLGLRADVEVLLAGMDIFALTSRSEGMPGVLIEAGMAGLPVISFDVGGASEVVLDGETGVIVPMGDETALVNGLEELVKRPGWRKQLGDEARTWTMSKFDLEIVAGQFEQLFQDLLNGTTSTLSTNIADAESQ